MRIIRVKKSAWKKREELRFQCGGFDGQKLRVQLQCFTGLGFIYSTYKDIRHVLGEVLSEEELLGNRVLQQRIVPASRHCNDMKHSE